MLGKLQAKKVDHYFNVMDTNKDGVVGQDEISAYFANFAALSGLQPGSAQYNQFRADSMGWWDRVCAAADTDGDRRITRAEWHAFWSAWLDAIADEAVHGERRTLEQLIQSSQVLFNLRDVNRDGRISPEEFGWSLAAWGHQVDVAETFKKLDLNGDGYLSLEEITSLLREFVLSNDPDAPGNYLYGPPY